MRVAAWLCVSLAAAFPVPAAAAPGFCEDLRLMIGSVRDTPPFSSVTRILPPPPLALFRDCLANNVGFISEVTCTWHRQPAVPATSIEDLAAEAVRCLPGARRREDPAATVRGEAVLDFELLAITIGRSPIVPAMPGDGVRVTVSIPEG